MEILDLAVIQTGGKQYLVRPGQTLVVEKLAAAEDMNQGEQIIFDQVLLRSKEDEVQIGTPTLASSVHATLIENGRHKKIEVLKFKAKSRYKKRYGHRQPFSKVRIEKID